MHVAVASLHFGVALLITGYYLDVYFGYKRSLSEPIAGKPLQKFIFGFIFAKY